MRYYLDLFTPETWAAFRKSGGGISGFREKQRKSAERIKSGDVFSLLSRSSFPMVRSVAGNIE
jgi:hypothetical protein